MLSPEDIEKLLPAERTRFRSPIPTQSVASDEFLPALQNPRQREFEARIKQLGSELAALQGGENVLRRDRPRLAISLYHRSEDFFAIPLWIDGLGCGYRFYLQHYSIHGEETVLYAIS